MDPHDSSHIYLGGWGYIAETWDGGETWSEGGDPINNGAPEMAPGALAVDSGDVVQTIYAGFSGVWRYNRLLPGEGDRYVATSGSDDLNACLDPAAPCLTIDHAVQMANAGESIFVAQGSYVENLKINKRLSLMGGYEASGWTRDIAAYETIIDGSNGQPVIGDWDGRSVGAPAVVATDDGFEMWYEGWPSEGAGQLGRATSVDGKSWSKDAENPRFEAGAPGDWDEGSVFDPSVLLDGGTYDLWYAANDHPTGVTVSRQPNPPLAASPLGATPFATGYAVATGNFVWTRSQHPVLKAGFQGVWDEGGILGPSVLKVEGPYYWLWYHAWTGVTGQIGCAISFDKINWTKCDGNPVFRPNAPDLLGANSTSDWYETAVSDPVVLQHDGMYHMWYKGTADDFPNQVWHISYVTSTDGVNWNRFLDGPVLTGADGEWDEGSVGPGSVLYDGTTYHMWYEANGQIGYAWSEDGISWTKFPGNPVLEPGEPGQHGKPVVTFEDGSDGAVLDGFTITGGKSDQAGGVDADHQDITIRRCRIQNNYADGSPYHSGGGGVKGDNLTIEDSRIINNEVQSGASGVRVGKGHLTMVNTLVADNLGDEGLHLNGAASLMNVTIAGNAPGTGRPGVNFNPQAGGTMEVVNSIIYGNGSADAFHVRDRDWIQVSYSDIERGWPGESNIDADPLFVDAANGDYHLQKHSPAIDAGANAGAPDHDLDGAPRPWDGDEDGQAVTDMGAYEFVRYQSYLPIMLSD
jgi:predicted GH43/DUF377 family glycosyl hydrolase